MSYYPVREHGNCHEKFVALVWREMTVFLSFTIYFSRFSVCWYSGSKEPSKILKIFIGTRRSFCLEILTIYFQKLFFCLIIAVDVTKFSISKFISLIMNSELVQVKVRTENSFHRSVGTCFTLFRDRKHDGEFHSRRCVCRYNCLLTYFVWTKPQPSKVQFSVFYFSATKFVVWCFPTTLYNF
jgi:hypothetical protein